MVVFALNLSACSMSIRSWSSKVLLTTSPFFGNKTALYTQFKDSNVAQNPSIYNRDFFGTSVTYVSYTSDEYCLERGCGATNIALRSSIDGYASRIDVTQNRDVKSDFSKVLVTSDGTIHVIYSSYEYHSAILNFAERTKPILASSFSARTDLTQQTMYDASHLSAGMRSNDEVIVAYDSREYCDTMACTHRSVVVRSSSDSYASHVFVTDGTECDATEPKISIQPGNDEVHMVWSRASAGACTVTTSDNMHYRSTRMDADFGTAIPGSLQITVQADGTLWTFFSVLGGACPGWGLYSQKNLPNNSWDVTSPKISCGINPYSQNWSVLTAADNAVHLAYLSNDNLGVVNPNNLSHRSSADSFVTADVATANNFGSQLSPILAVDSLNQMTLGSVSSGNVVAGLNLYESTHAWARVKASASTAGSVHFSTDRHGVFWMTYLSSEYCVLNSCSRLNYVAKSLATGQVIYLTQFTSDSIQLAAGKLAILKDGTKEFYYQSSEFDSTVYNIARRSEVDAFASRTDVTSGTTLVLLDDILYQQASSGNGIVHLAMANHGGLENLYANSTDFTATQVQLSGTENHTSTLSVNENNNEVASFYGGNESGAWRPNLRTSADGFVTRQTFVGNAWSNRAAAFDEGTGNLYALTLTNEAVVTDYNFAVRDRASGWSVRTDLFAVAHPTDLSLCVGATLLQVDANHVMHLVYASREKNSSFCNVAYRNSLDWSKRVDLTSYTDKDAYPQALFFSKSSVPVACSTAVVEASCTVIPQ